MIHNVLYLYYVTVYYREVWPYHLRMLGSQCFVYMNAVFGSVMGFISIQSLYSPLGTPGAADTNPSSLMTPSLFEL